MIIALLMEFDLSNFFHFFPIFFHVSIIRIHFKYLDRTGFEVLDPKVKKTSFCSTLKKINCIIYLFCKTCFCFRIVIARGCLFQLLIIFASPHGRGVLSVVSLRIFMWQKLHDKCFNKLMNGSSNISNFSVKVTKQNPLF